MPYPLLWRFRGGCVAPDKFFSENFFPPQILLGWLILRFGGVFSVVFNKIG
nr:MAG TPA_asm: hypothetical protein [Caudoviricetes sp.]